VVDVPVASFITEVPEPTIAAGAVLLGLFPLRRQRV
jgi:hypothetical protein